MSWDGYIDSIIGNSQGAISSATIVGLNGAIWTPKTAEKILEISQSEATSIGTIMAAKNNSIQGKFSAQGITIGGAKYMFLRDVEGDGRTILAKKSGLGNLTLVATTQAVLIAFTPEAKSHSFGIANTAVDGIAKYLEGSGY